MKNTSVFEEALASAKRDFFDLEHDYLHRTCNKSVLGHAKLKNKLAYLSNLAALWAPKAPKMILGGIRTVDARKELHIASTPSGIRNALSETWGEVFSRKLIDTEAAWKLAKQYAKRCKWEWDLCTPPGQSNICTFTQIPNSFFSGKDNILYCA